MSARSSSGSWSGGGAATQDIIDLDKFMRGGVRPARPDNHNLRCEELVVDAGGVDRKPVPVPATLPVLSGPVPPEHTAPSSSSGSRPPPHAKRFSHDSGLSDGSYARRKHRPHRRAVTGDTTAGRPARSAAGSSNSLRAFRAVCERALLDQQAQIARVAQLCERLTERAPRRRSDRSATPDTSDVSSSSRSTRDLRRKDKHRTEECKTYKIIMNKLDELNRLFAARARSPAALPPHVTHPAHGTHSPHGRRVTPSSGSVSVSDKVVATEPERRPPVTPPIRHTAPIQVNHNTVTVRGGCESSGGRGSAGGVGGAGVSSRLSGLCAIANTCALDIAPHDALPSPARHNIATESVVEGGSRPGTASSAGDPRCGFDLEDPVHLYSQAKRLQALPARTRRARSVEAGERTLEERLERLDERLAERLAQRNERLPERHERLAERHAARRKLNQLPQFGRTFPRVDERPRDKSLCALCRGYWRALRHYLAAQIFCYPDTTCH